MVTTVPYARLTSILTRGFYFSGRTKLEPIAIVVLSVVMSLASVQMIRESVEKIIYYTKDKGSGPRFEVATIVICSLTVGM